MHKLPPGPVFQVVSVDSNGTNQTYSLEENELLSYAIKDGQISDTLVISSQGPQKLIVKFKEAPLIKYRGKSKKFRDTAVSRINLEHKRFANDILELENACRNSKGKPPVNIKKILKKKYKHVFNGAAVEFSREILGTVEQLDYVEAVYPDIEVKVNLNDSVPLIGATQVWADLGFTGKGIVVSIVDTGIDYTHPDLGGSAVFPNAKVIGGYDCYNNDNDPMDDHYHGTHVAGIVAANGELKGVAYEASLMAYKVLSAYGSGRSSTIIQGIELSTDPDGDPGTDDGADIINMSLGGSGNPDDPMSQAVDNAVDSGVVVVVAAGNDYSYWAILSPGVARKALTVGATDKTDRLASFSSKGPVLSTYAIKPDVTAPGVGILASQLGGGNRSLSGTSMATPHVAGAAALLLQSNPALSPAQVKHILMGTAVDLGYNVFCQGTGGIDVYEAISSKTIVSPASISLGLDDVAQLIWAKTQTVEIKNISGDSTLNTYTVSLAEPLAAGIDISVPAAITLDAQTATGSFDFTISVDNTVLAYPSADPYSYEGILLVSNGTDTHRLAFAFTMSPVLTLNYDISPHRIFIIDRVSKYWYRYGFGTSISMTLPQGTYDVISMFANSTVFREDIDLVDNTVLNISSAEAVHDLTFSNIVDHAGNSLIGRTYIYWNLNHDSGFGYGNFGGRSDLKFSDMSERYTFEWSASDLMRDYAVTHELGSRIAGGISSDHDFTNTPDEYRAIEYTYEVEPTADDMFMLHFLHHVYRGSMIGWSAYNIYDAPFTRDANGQFKRTFYIKPFETTDGITKTYSSQRVYDYTGDGVFNSSQEKLLYITPLISELAGQPFKGYFFPEFDNPVFSTTNIDQMVVGMGPHYWSGKLRTNSSTVSVDASIGQGRLHYTSQWGDFDLLAESYWQLLDENGQTVRSGQSTGTSGLYRGIFLPYAGMYKLVVPYDGFYYIGDLPGNITTTLDFDTTRADADPPYMQHFKVLSHGRVSNFMLEGLLNTVEFDLLDDKSSLANASLYIKPYAQEVDWQLVSLDVTGTKHTALVPDFAADDFVSMKLVAVDTAGNSLTTQWDPAFYYQTNPGLPVTDAGEDKQISVEPGSDTALVTLDASTSYDADGYIVSYLWKEDSVVLGSSAVIEVALTIGTHDITLIVTDNDGLTATDTIQVVVTREAPSGQCIYVQDITITAKKKGKVWDVIAEVTIFDDSSDPVKSVEVFGNWGGSVNQTVSAVTFSKGKKRIGRTKFTLSRISGGGTFTFTITDVKKSGMIYDNDLNVETSDTIVIQ